MLGVALRRVIIGVPLVIGVSILVFLVLHVLPGNPVDAALAGAPATPSVVHALEVRYGLTRPLYVQYGEFFVHALEGNLGRSYITNQTVTSLIGSQLGATIQLTISALILTVVIGLSGGVLAALRRGRLTDHVLRIFSVWGSAMPVFWVGILLIIVFSFKIHWFPAAGSGGVQYVVLPAVALALVSSGIVIRVVRSAVLECLSLPYVAALDAKGLTKPAIVGKHILRNALIPAVTVLGVQVGGLLSGAVVVETVFGRQGIGSLLVDAVEQKNYPVIQGVMLFIAIAYVVVNIVVDVSYAYLDPRVRSTLTESR